MTISSVSQQVPSVWTAEDGRRGNTTQSSRLLKNSQSLGCEHRRGLGVTAESSRFSCHDCWPEWGQGCGKTHRAVSEKWSSSSRGISSWVSRISQSSALISNFHLQCTCYGVSYIRNHSKNKVVKGQIALGQWKQNTLTSHQLWDKGPLISSCNIG